MNLVHFSSAELSAHDLSLLIDPQGRLWRFHSSDGHDTAQVKLDAHLEGTGLVITVDEPVPPEDVHVAVRDHVMEISRDGEGTPKHLADVLLPDESEGEGMTVRTHTGGFDLVVPVRDLHSPAQ